MPKIEYYKIEQTRSVEVVANNETDALAIAEEAFRTNSNVDLTRFPGNRVGATRSVPRIISVYLTKEQP